MRALKLYGGSILVLLVIAFLAVAFYTEMLQDPKLNGWILGVSFVLVVVGIVCNFVVGGWADKIGGKK